MTAKTEPDFNQVVGHYSKHNLDNLDRVDPNSDRLRRLEQKIERLEKLVEKLIAGCLGEDCRIV